MKKKPILFVLLGVLVLAAAAVLVAVPQLRFLSEANRHAEKFAEYRADFEAAQVYLEKTFENAAQEDLSVRFGLVGDAEGKLFCMRRGASRVETVVPDEEMQAHFDALMRAFVQMGTELRALRIRDGVLSFEGNGYSVLYAFSGEKPAIASGRVAKLEAPWYQVFLKEASDHA